MKHGLHLDKKNSDGYMKLKKRQIYEFDVSGLAFGGKGIAKPEGFPVFIDRTLPGDRVTAKVIKKKKGYAEARTVRLLEKSDLREAPLCSYAAYCGGCKWQDLPYDRQLVYKRDHVAESLQHIGGLADIPVKETIPSATVFHYRNKMEFTFTPARWLLPEELGDDTIKKDMGLGLHVPGTFNKVIDIGQCHIMPELGNRIMADVRQFARASGLPAYDLRTHEGFWRFLMLRHAVSSDQWMVNLVTAREDDEVLMALAKLLSETYPQVSSVMNNITARKAGVAVGEREKCLRGTPSITEHLGAYRFDISANSFFQTNTKTAERLYSVVSRYAGLTGEEVVLDLYSGTGTIPVWLSNDARQIVGIEIVPGAVTDAYRNAALNGIRNIEFIAGDIREVLSSADIRPDVMIIDPPRAGMHKDVLKEVMTRAPSRIVYVSCNPATLARDLAALTEAYQLTEVQPVDMFPHTYHIESVALLQKI